MTDVNVGGLSLEDVRIQKAADQAFRVLDGEENPCQSSVFSRIYAERRLKRLSTRSRSHSSWE